MANADLKMEVNTFVESVEKAVGRVASLERVPFEGMTNDELVTVYGMVNRMKKLADNLRTRAKDAVDERIRSFTEEGEHGELVLTQAGAQAGLTQDENGVLRLEASNGSAVELRPRTKTEFLEKVAREILEQKNLLEFAVDRETVITDPEGLRQAFESVQERLVQMGEVELAQKMEDALAAATEVRETLSQAKIENLVRRGKVTGDELDRMFSVTTSYALYDK